MLFKFDKIMKNVVVVTRLSILDVSITGNLKI